MEMPGDAECIALLAVMAVVLLMDVAMFALVIWSVAAEL